MQTGVRPPQLALYTFLHVVYPFVPLKCFEVIVPRLWQCREVVSVYSILRLLTKYFFGTV